MSNQPTVTLAPALLALGAGAASVAAIVLAAWLFEVRLSAPIAPPWLGPCICMLGIGAWAAASRWIWRARPAEQRTALFFLTGICWSMGFAVAGFVALAALYSI